MANTALFAGWKTCIYLLCLITPEARSNQCPTLMQHQRYSYLFATPWQNRMRQTFPLYPPARKRQRRPHAPHTQHTHTSSPGELIPQVRSACFAVLRRNDLNVTFSPAHKCTALVDTLCHEIQHYHTRMHDASSTTCIRTHSVNVESRAHAGTVL